MRATQLLHNLGQSIWLDNITRDLLTSGTLQRYINEFPVTGLTSNPTIFEKALVASQDYDEAMVPLVKAGKSAQEIYEALALEEAGRVHDPKDGSRNQMPGNSLDHSAALTAPLTMGTSICEPLRLSVMVMDSGT